RRHTRFSRDWSSDVCSSDLRKAATGIQAGGRYLPPSCAKRGCLMRVCITGAAGYIGSALLEELRTWKGVEIFAVDKEPAGVPGVDRKSTRLNSSHVKISYAG